MIYDDLIKTCKGIGPSSSEGMAQSAWCMMRGACSIVRDARHMVHGVNGAWCMAHAAFSIKA